MPKSMHKSIGVICLVFLSTFISASAQAATFTQGNLQGNWSGNWLDLGSMYITVNASGNYTGTGLGSTLTGKLTLVDGGAGRVSGNIIFGGSVGFDLDLTLSSPGLAGTPLRLRGSVRRQLAGATWISNGMDISGGDSSPTVAAAPAASPNPVQATTTYLTVLGADNNGEAALTYTWSLTSGPAPVAFSPNSSNAAKHALATFTRAGAYALVVLIKDAHNLTVSAPLSVTVDSVLTNLSVSPPSASVFAGNTTGFTASGVDQFGNRVPAAHTSWSVSGGGIISNSGLFSAVTPGGPFTVTAVSSGFTATASMTVKLNTPPSITSGPDATPNPTLELLPVQFSAAAGDPDAQPLTYRWDFDDGTTGSGAGVSHTYSAAGTYAVQLSVSDGLATTSELLQVLVNPLPVRALEVSTLNLDLNFLSAPRDRMSLLARLPLPGSFNPMGAQVTLDVGGAAITFHLDQQGLGKALRLGTLRLSYDATLDQWVLKASLKKGWWSFSKVWEDEGLTNSESTLAPVALPVTVTIFGGQPAEAAHYRAQVPATYTAHRGKGRARSN